MPTWTKITKDTLGAVVYGWGTQPWGTSPWGGDASDYWTKITKATDTWTKISTPTDT